MLPQRIKRPYWVGIAGPSGAGKSWLCARLREVLGKEAACLSLDDFYRDRGGRSAAQCARVNFDHPRAIDWDSFEKVLREGRTGKPLQAPSYDFTTHRRREDFRVWRAKPVVLLEGLWVLRRRSVRQLLDLGVYVSCPEARCLERRLERDCRERGRTGASVRQQFAAMVWPMARRFVCPQERWADVVVRAPLKEGDVQRLADRIRGEIQSRRSR